MHSFNNTHSENTTKNIHIKQSFLHKLLKNTYPQKHHFTIKSQNLHSQNDPKTDYTLTCAANLHYFLPNTLHTLKTPFLP